MLQMKRSIILETIEEIIVSYDFLTDAQCVKVLDLTKRQFCWIDYNSQHMKITIFKTIWNYYLSK